MFIHNHFLDTEERLPDVVFMAMRDVVVDIHTRKETRSKVKDVSSRFAWCPKLSFCLGSLATPHIAFVTCGKINRGRYRNGFRCTWGLIKSLWYSGQHACSRLAAGCACEACAWFHCSYDPDSCCNGLLGRREMRAE